MDAELRPKDPVKGKLVAFEAETRDQGAPPRLVVFDGPAKDLFEVLRPQIGSQCTADTTYARVGPGDKWFLGIQAPIDASADRPVATTRLIPIPMAWAAYFLDSSDFGVAVRRLDSLVEAIPRLKRVQFSPIMDLLLLACYGDRQDNKCAYSVLSSGWDPLQLHPRTKAWMQERWTRVTSNETIDSLEASGAEDERKMPARQNIQAPSMQYKSPGDPMLATMQGHSSKRARTGAASTVPTAFTLANLGPLVSEILKAQAESNLQLHQSFQTNMLANIQATSTALAATGSGKESKLSDSKLRILQACSGHGDLPSFVLSKFYAELDKNGITSDNCGMVLCRLVVTVHGSANQCNVHISPKVIAAAKTLNFSHNNDCTFVGCTSGITPFAVP